LSFSGNTCKAAEAPADDDITSQADAKSQAFVEQMGCVLQCCFQFPVSLHEMISSTVELFTTQHANCC
jgi:hypothetical protein